MIRKVIRLVLVVGLTLPLGASASNDEVALEVGIRQVKEGDLSKAVLTLDAVIRGLGPEAANAKELSQAHLYRGIALVGLQQEEPAKTAFREALRYDAALRLKKGEQPDRVVRIFEAARTGKTKSVLERPSGAPKKAGLGAGGIALIGAAIVAAGGAAVAAGGSSTPSPPPATPPALSTVVTPTAGSGPGTITYVNAAPAPGSVLAQCNADLSACSERLALSSRSVINGISGLRPPQSSR